MKGRGRVAPLLGGAFIATWFGWRTHLSLRAEFTHDDLMNSWHAVFKPLATHVRECILFFLPSASYRPFPELVYKAFIQLFGFDLFPLRVLLLAVMGLNILLTYLLARRLSGRREVGLVAAMLGAYHFHLNLLYFNTGGLFDIFCSFFYLCALVFHLRIRQAGRLLGWHELTAFSALYVLALDSKELAVSLPVVIAAWELLFRPPSFRPAPLLRWQYKEMLPVWVTGIMTASYIQGRVLAMGGLGMTGGYAVSLSPATYLGNTARFLNELLYSHGLFDAAGALALLVGLLTAAGLARSKTLGMCWVVYVVGVLPVAFLAYRGLYSAWLPTTGLLIYAALAAVSLRDAILHRLGRPRWRPAGQALLFGLAAALLVKAHPDLRFAFDAWQPEYSRIREVRESLQRLCPFMPPKSTVLIVNDPFPESFSAVFIIYLLYRDPSIVVNKLSSFDKPLPREQWAGYDYIFDFVNGKLLRLNPADFAPPRVPPAPVRR